MSRMDLERKVDRLVRIAAHAVIPLLALLGLLLLIMLPDTGKMWGFVSLGVAVVLMLVVDRLSGR